MLADLGQLLRVGRSYYKAERAGRAVGIERSIDHLAVERAACYIEPLEIRRAGIRCQRQNKHATARIVEERLQRIHTHVRIDCHRIEAVQLQHRRRITLGGVADIPPLGVADRDRILRKRIERAEQCRMPAASIALVEGEVQLVGDTEVMRCLDDPHVEGEQRIGAVSDDLRQVPRIGVQTDAEPGGPA